MKLPIGHRPYPATTARWRAAGVGASVLAHVGIGWLLWTGTSGAAPSVPLPIAVRFVEIAPPAPIAAAPPAQVATVPSAPEAQIDASPATAPAPAAVEAEPKTPLRKANPQRRRPAAAKPVREAQRVSNKRPSAAALERRRPLAAATEVPPSKIAVEPAPSARVDAIWGGASTSGEQVSPTAAQTTAPASAPPAAQAAAPANSATSAAAPLSIAPPRSDAAYLRNPAPAYPTMSRRLGEQGLVVLRVFVEPDGRPSAVSVRNSSGSSRLDSAALDAVRVWTFVPAHRGEERVAAWVLVPVHFRLNNG